MPKATNKRVIATEEVRRAASRVAGGRSIEKEWKQLNQTRSDKLKALVGETDVNLVTENGQEVAVISEIIIQSYDYPAFFKAHPHLLPELEVFKKAPVTQIRVNTTWVEPGVDATSTDDQ